MKWRDFSPGGPLPATWTDNIEELLSTYVSPNFALTRASATTVQVVASAGTGQVGIAVASSPRYNAATVTAAHPGGAEGLYDVYVTATADAFHTNASAQEVDDTTRTFGLKILATGSTPSGSGAEALYRRVAQVYWDGAAIQDVRPLISSPRNIWYAPLANRPAASQANAGTLFIAEDTLAQFISTGTAWAQVTAQVAPHAATHLPGGSDELDLIKTFQLAHHILVPGPVNVPSGQLDYVPPIAVPVIAGQSTKLARIRYRLNNGAVGTTVSFKIQINGADAVGLGTSASPLVTATSNAWAETDPTDIALNNNDQIQLVVVGIAGTPQNLSVAVVLEHAV